MERLIIDSIMGGLQYDVFANPLGVVRSTFEKAMAAAASSTSDPAAFGGVDWGAVEIFKDYLLSEHRISQVPYLTPASIHRLQPNTLVRYRGMIQDMPGNEFYAGAYKDGSMWRTNKFTDVCQVPMSPMAETRIWERRLLYCTPIPGRNSWTLSSDETAINGNTGSTSYQREKRHREEDEAVDHMVSDEELQGSPTAKKFKEDGQHTTSSMTEDSTTEGIYPGIPMATGVEQNGLPCLVKVYDSPESDFKLNDVFEFVGILMFDPEPSTGKDDMDRLSNDFFEDTLTQPLPSKVPRLHSLIHIKLDECSITSGGAPTLEVLRSNPCLVREIREALLGHLTAALGNDGIAAHFVLLHLLSRVHGRIDNGVLGKFSLNLIRFNEESASVFGDRLRLWIKNVLPLTQNIPLTVEYLNSASLAPTKDYETDRLTPGVLQLPQGSHLLVDETRLEPGTLNSVGIENIRLLLCLSESQKVDYDFKYYKLNMETDVKLLILSEGRSNIVPADVVIPFQPSSTGSNGPVAAETLEAWRQYLSFARALSHSIDDEMTKVLEDDLVAATQADRTLKIEDFNRWLTMARLLCVSYGEERLSLERWQMVKELERIRKERFNRNS